MGSARASVEEDESFRVSRRTVLSYGSLTAGGLFIASAASALPGCASPSEDDTEDGTGAASAGDFLPQYDAAGANTDKVAGTLAQAQLVGLWIKTKYDALFAELRKSRPVLVTPLFVKNPGYNPADASKGPEVVQAPIGAVPTLVANYTDVTRVMTERTTFTVAAYKREMERNVDHFTLEDLIDTQHDEDKKAMLEAMAKLPTAEQFRPVIRKIADDLVAAGLKKKPGSFDVVQDFARILPIKIVSAYFGIPTVESAALWKSSPFGTLKLLTDAEVYLHVANAFQNFFLNLTSPNQEVQVVGTASSQAMLKYIDSVVQILQPRIAAGEEPVGLLGQFIVASSKKQFARIQPTPSAGDAALKIPAGLIYRGIAANIFGIVAGAVTGIEKSIANIMDVLTTPDTAETPGRAAGFAGAVQAAQGSDSARMWKYATEALRFKPQGIAVARVTAKDSTFGSVTIPKGAFVLAAHPSAMNDEKEPTFKNPTRFDSTRDVTKYLHFGFSNFECLGKNIATVELTEAIGALCRIKGLKRGAGTLVYGKTDSIVGANAPLNFPSTFVLDCSR